VICPGIINTKIAQTARLRSARLKREELIDIYERRNYGPEKVASAILGAVISNRAIVPVTPEAWVTYALKRALPASTPGIVQGVIERGRRRSKKKEDGS
jgi:hypothetical protein